ncbi:MAG TPA: hypothetical protein VJA20_03055 [Candidatus Nanoarchaeia archaeon]|nr:hypothetical protein [Candidatus Nanoarchaeia archaeon]
MKSLENKILKFFLAGMMISVLMTATGCRTYEKCPAYTDRDKVKVNYSAKKEIYNADFKYQNF